jgi:TolA-binding protein
VKRIGRARPQPRPLRFTATSRDERAVANLVTELPDATPDDLSVERVWRRLQSPDPGPSRAWRWATASVLATALAVCAGLLWLETAKPKADILLAEGGLFSSASAASWAPARRGDPLAAGASVRSDRSGRGVLRVPGVAALILDTDADLALVRLGRSTVLRLERGAVTARVIKRSRGERFVLLAGDYTVTVVGTLFSVTNASDGRVAVSVNEGVVEVEGRGNLWRIEAGHRWSSDSSEVVVGSEISEARAALLAAAMSAPRSPELAGLFSAMVRADCVPTPVPPVAPDAPIPAEIPPAEAIVPPVAAAGLSQATSVRRRHGVASSPLLAAAEATTRRDERPEAPRPLTMNQPAIAPAPSPSTPVRERDYYAEALNLARHGEHSKAASVLTQALAAGRGPRDLELYQLALLKQRHLSDPQGALDSLQGYRKEFPGGALRQEVDLSIVESEVALGRSEAALAESARFLAQHPQSERADEVRVLRGDLLRQAGACEKAAAEYRAVSGGPALDDALYYWAYCQRQLGDSASAAAALRDYLVRFPAGRHLDAAREALGR